MNRQKFAVLNVLAGLLYAAAVFQVISGIVGGAVAAADVARLVGAWGSPTPGASFAAFIVPFFTGLASAVLYITIVIVIQLLLTIEENTRINTNQKELQALTETDKQADCKGLTEVESFRNWFCKKCGTENYELSGVGYCRNCGKKMRQCDFCKHVWFHEDYECDRCGRSTN